MFYLGIIAGQASIAHFADFWYLDPTGITATWTAIAYGSGDVGNYLVAVGDDGSLASFDGFSFTERTPASASPWKAVHFASTGSANWWVAAAYDGSIMTCDQFDITSWSSQTPSVSGQWTCIESEFSSDIIVVLGDDGTCMTSPDSTTWTTRTVPNEAWKAICKAGFVNAIFTAVGHDSACMTSMDGISWTSRTIPTGDWNSICLAPWGNEGNGVLVAVGNAGKIATSIDDGVNWTLRTSPISDNLTDVAASGWEQLTLTAVTDEGNAIVSYDEGVTWEQSDTDGITDPWASVVYTDIHLTEFVAVSTNGAVMRTD